MQVQSPLQGPCEGRRRAFPFPGSGTGGGKAQSGGSKAGQGQTRPPQRRPAGRIYFAKKNFLLISQFSNFVSIHIETNSESKAKSDLFTIFLINLKMVITI